MKNSKRYKLRMEKYKKKMRREKFLTRKESDAPKQRVPYLLIDGNYGYRPAAYCEHYKAWLTEGLINVHRCRRRHCRKLTHDWRENEHRTK